MLLLVPHLFPSARLLEMAAQDLRLPALEVILARGSSQAFSGEGIEAALCQALGIDRQQDWPLAPITLQADGGDPGTDYWLRADPVYLGVMRDRIVLADCQALELDQAEADALAASIHAHFGETFSPLPLQPRRWYLRLPQALQLRTTPLSCATGCDIDPLLPRGHDASRLRALSNEIQMLMHDHPVNQSREARGQLPVNSLWLWGGGILPKVQPGTLKIATDHPDALALISFAGAARVSMAAGFDQDRPDVVLLETLVAAGQSGDAFGWREGVREIDKLLQGLLQDGRGFTLADPVRGRACAWRKASRFKLWRRPSRPEEALR
ncbi:MAG: hypothetical protein MUE59_13435 [Thiobacillaceae bacterium]|jgi:hypothetical protein|nr:hypothetical protein [Thiobacillaceae bacterium]